LGVAVATQGASSPGVVAAALSRTPRARPRSPGVNGGVNGTFGYTRHLGPRQNRHGSAPAPSAGREDREGDLGRPGRHARDQGLVDAPDREEGEPAPLDGGRSPERGVRARAAVGVRRASLPRGHGRAARRADRCVVPAVAEGRQGRRARGRPLPRPEGKAVRPRRGGSQRAHGRQRRPDVEHGP
jgi:hypothetical protein